MTTFMDMPVRRELAAILVGETRTIAGRADVRRTSWTSFIIVGEDVERTFDDAAWRLYLMRVV